MSTKVEVAEYCSYKNMEASINEAILKEYESKCLGNHECEIEVNIDTMFNMQC
jgi:hypothetical protein